MNNVFHEREEFIVYNGQKSRIFFYKTEYDQMQRSDISYRHLSRKISLK